MNKQKQSISLVEFTLILVNLKFENDHLIKRFNDLSKEIKTKNDKSSNDRFLEYLILYLFIDNACLLLAFGKEISLKIFEIYSANIIARLTTRGYKIKWKKFERLFKKRFAEYQPYLQEYDPEYIKKIDTRKYLSGLGKIFSTNFIGYKDPFLANIIHGYFVVTLKYFYGEFLKNIVEKYDIVLQK